MALDYLSEVVSKLNDNPGLFENYQKRLREMFLELANNHFVMSNAIETIFEQVRTTQKRSSRNLLTNLVVLVHKRAKLPLHRSSSLLAIGQLGSLAKQHFSKFAGDEDGISEHRAGSVHAERSKTSSWHNVVSRRTFCATEKTGSMFFFSFETRFRLLTSFLLLIGFQKYR